MAIGTTGTLDPETGQRVESQFEYTPVDPQDEMMRQAFERSQQAFYPPPPQPQGPTPYWENPATYYPRQEQPDPVAQAKAATAAAYKYIAFRGYQQDLKEGKSAADAFAKWGPMLVQDTSFAPAMKAIQTPAAYTYNQNTRAYESPGQRPVFNPHAATPETPTFVPANPATGEPAHYVGGGKIQPIKPESAAKIDPLTLSDYKQAQTEFTKALKVYEDPAETEDMRKEARTRMGVAKARMENIRKGAGQVMSQPSPQVAPSAAPEAPKSTVRIHVKDSKGKDWTIPEWQVPIATKQGFTVVK